MTKEKFRSIFGNDKELFNLSLNIVTKFMTDDDEDRNEYKRKLIEMIDHYVKENPDELSKRHREHLKKVAGFCVNKTYLDSFINRKFKMFPLGKRHKCDIAINKELPASNFEFLLTSVHELNHADTIQYSNSLFVVYFNGLTREKTEDFNSTKKYGTGLNEAINEIYTQVQVFSRFPNEFTNIRIVDDLIYSPRLPQYRVGHIKSGGPYRELGLLAKLLLIAADNDLFTSYEKLKNDGKKFIEKTVEPNGKPIIKNDLLYAGKKNVKEYGKQFDNLCGKFGLFVTLLEKFDYLLNQIKNGQSLDKTKISQIISIIRIYKNAKYDMLINNGYWTETIRNEHEEIFDKYEKIICAGFEIDIKAIPTIKDNNINKKR